MQDHCNGHRCHGDRFSLYEKCSHRQDLLYFTLQVKTIKPTEQTQESAE